MSVESNWPAIQCERGSSADRTRRRICSSSRAASPDQRDGGAGSASDRWLGVCAIAAATNEAHSSAAQSTAATELKAWGSMSVAGPPQDANAPPRGAAQRQQPQAWGSMSVAGPPQDANAPPRGAAQRRQPQAWGSMSVAGPPQDANAPPRGAAQRRQPQAWGSIYLPKQEFALQVPAFLRHAFESGLCEKLPAPDHVGNQHRGVRVGVAMPSIGGLRDAQRLPQRGLELVGQLIDPGLQPFILMHQCVADQHACHAWILFGKRKKHHDGLFGLHNAVGRLAVDLVDQRKERRLDELDQAFEHLCLACEVAIERSLRDVESRCERGGRHLFTPRLIAHRSE